MKHDGQAHLLPAAREQAQLGSEDRVKGLLRDRWIDYPRATEALQVLQRLYETLPPRRYAMPLVARRFEHWEDQDYGEVQACPSQRI
ncbi:hypothetical protein [Paraburkholderia xenovorans]|uniref:hypothetical protein n=1 Tax=Paraburkholderia xenovorans TaxID=36873 RepID=UPI0038BB22EC